MTATGPTAEQITADHAPRRPTQEDRPVCTLPLEEHTSHPLGVENAPKIPSGGSPGPDCGEYMPRRFCSSDGCGHVQNGPVWCNKRVCPDCEPRWRLDATDDLALDLARWDLHTHLLQGRQPRSWTDLSQLRYLHCMISFDDHQDELVTGDDYLEARTRAKELVKDAGMMGFALIPHHYRVRETAKTLLEAEGYGPGGDAGGYWEGIRDDAADLGTWEIYVTAGLHFHVIGFSGVRWTHEDRCPDHEDGCHPECEQILDDSETPDDVTWRRLGPDDEGRDLHTIDDLRATIFYVASHATPPDGRYWHTRIGALARATPSPTLDDQEERILEDRVLGDRPDPDDEDPCPCCGAEEWRPIWVARDWWETQTDEIEHDTTLKFAWFYVCFTEKVRRDLGEADRPPPPDPEDAEEVNALIHGDWQGKTSLVVDLLNAHLSDT